MTDSAPTRTLLDVSRRAWVRDVARFTHAWRRERAALLEVSHPGSAWHEARARGLRMREARAVECGVHGVETSCASCGEIAPRLRRKVCSDWRLCYPCRARRSRRAVARFHAGRSMAMERLAYRMRRRTPGGRWGEAFYTLTLPRLGFDSDWAAIRHAWPLFRRALRHYLASRGSPCKDVPMCRAVEVTSSKGGHWHVHVWSLLPYIPQWVLAHLWGASLPTAHRAACPTRRVADVECHPGTRDADALSYCAQGADVLFAPVVDVRSAQHAAAEIAKYMVKDIEHGAHVSPLWFADVYKALEGARTHEMSRGWLGKPRRITQGWHPLLLLHSVRRTEAFCGCGDCLPSSRAQQDAFVKEFPLGPPKPPA